MNEALDTNIKDHLRFIIFSIINPELFFCKASVPLSDESNYRIPGGRYVRFCRAMGGGL